MASTYTPLGVELQATGENAGTWGTKTNTNLQIVEQISGGYTTVNFGSDADVTLSVSDGSTGAALAHRVLEFTSSGSLTATRNCTIPLDVQNFYILKNSTTGSQTITFTAIKNTTGTNIKGWGSTVLMRPVGDSLTFLEQGPEGRIGRASEGKTNSGLFLMEPYNAINLKVMVEESLSIERGENKSHSDIVNETLACHFFYNGTNGKFAKLDKPDFIEKLEQMSSRGEYDISLCIKRVDVPTDFNDVFKNKTASVTEKVIINNEGNENAKNSKRKRIVQLELDLDLDGKNEKRQEKD